MKPVIFLLVALLFISGKSDEVEQVAEDPVLERIKEFPGWDRMPVPMWSGQLNIDDGKRSIHYLYVSSNNNKSDPVLLWMNGCSGLYGFGKEVGPYIIKDGEEKWSYNEFGWHKFASVIYIETPSGVGFSNYDNTTVWDDKLQAEDNYNALLAFFEKFPDLLANDFYISGESGAGIYIPFLAKKILDKNPTAKFKINLKGITVGNGATDATLGKKPLYEALHGFNLITTEQWDILTNLCPADPNAPKCKFAQTVIDSNLANFNMFDIYGDCYPADLSKGPACLDVKGLSQAFNDPEVKRNIHVDPDTQWAPCNMTILNAWKKDPEGSLPLYKDLMDKSLRILFYHGDTDLSPPLAATRAWLQKLNLGVVTPYRQWKVDNQVAGYITEYQGLTFATVKNGAHSTPKWKPAESFYLISQFLAKKPIAEDN